MELDFKSMAITKAGLRYINVLYVRFSVKRNSHRKQVTMNFYF